MEKTSNGQTRQSNLDQIPLLLSVFSIKGHAHMTSALGESKNPKILQKSYVHRSLGVEGSIHTVRRKVGCHNCNLCTLPFGPAHTSAKES